MISAVLNQRGHEQFVIFVKNLFWLEKAFFFKTEIEISTFQDVGHNLNGSPDMTYSKFSPNYELWWTE